MEEDGTLIEVSDVASGIDHSLRHSLWQLMEYKVGEDKESVLVEPLVIVQIRMDYIFFVLNHRYSVRSDVQGSPL